MSEVQQDRILQILSAFTLTRVTAHRAIHSFMLLKQTVWAEEWQNYPPFWLPSSLHPDKRMISFPVGIQHWLGSFRLSAPADPDDTTPPSFAWCFLLPEPAARVWLLSAFLAVERLRWKAKASFSLISPPTTWDAHRKLLEVSVSKQLLPAWAGILVGFKPILFSRN